MVTLALLHVLPPHLQQQKKKETKAEPTACARTRLFYLLLFSTDSDALWYVWVSLNSLRLRKWLGSQPSPDSLARKRQTSEIRHLFHLADPVEGLDGPRAYITKTNIRHFRGLHHKNRIRSVGLVVFMCWEGAALQTALRQLLRIIWRWKESSNYIIKCCSTSCHVSPGDAVIMKTSIIGIF